MTLAQIKTLITGVLKGWFTNKTTLDKFSEADGKLQYDGKEVGGGTTYTDAEIEQAITEALTELNASDATE